MRQLSAPCLQCRHRIALSFHHPTLGPPRVFRSPFRAASALSAIHRGLRDSQKAKSQGFTPASLATAAAPRASNKCSTSRSRRDPDWEKPTYKITKGKKDITDKGPQPKSRSLRFNDPTESFGKKSMVWQMKHGGLKEKLAGMAAEKGIVSRSKEGVMSKSDFEKSFFASGSRDDRGKGGKGGRNKSAPAKKSSRKDQGRFAGKEDDPFFQKFNSQRSGKGDDRFAKKDQDRFARRDDDRSFRGNDTFSRKSDDWSAKKDEDRFSRGDRFVRKDDNQFSRKGDDRFARKDQGRGFQRDNGPVAEKSEPDALWDELASRHVGRAASATGSTSRSRTDDRPTRADQDRFPREDRAGFGRRGGDRQARDEGQPSKEFAFQRARNSFTNNNAARSEEDGQDREPQPVADETFGGLTRFTRENNAQRRAEKERDDVPIRIHHTTAASQFLYGRSVIEAALRDTRRKLYRLYIYNGEDRQNTVQDSLLEQMATRKGIRVIKVGREGMRMLDKMSGGRPHNGCVLEASPLPQLPIKSLGALSQDSTKPGYNVEIGFQTSEEAEVNGKSDFVGYKLPAGRQPFVLLLDEILDPGNLGAILRSAAFLGADAVAISKHSSATLTPVALKASAGASEVMTLFSVASTVDFLTRSKEAGWMVCAAVPATARSRDRSRGNSHLTLDRVESYDLLATQPTVLVVGSEGEGLTKQVRRVADYEVSIPGVTGFGSAVDSLNVSVATGILCSAFLKKQRAAFEIQESLPVEAVEGNDTKLW